MQINFNRVYADYQLGPIRSKNVVDGISLELAKNTFTAVVGHTGAGKSSLLKLLNGLLLPTDGEVSVGDLTIDKNGKKKTLNKVRKRVGMVFQFPERQLFAETVEQDIAFGPKNFGFSKEEITQLVDQSLKQVGLTPDILPKSPFSLSGGQKRRVAIAGIIATKPDVLVLDEPGAGLDPEGKQEILAMLRTLHDTHDSTTILVTHDMNDVVTYCDNVLVMEKGQVTTHQTVRGLFSNQNEIDRLGIGLPEPLRLQRLIEEHTGRVFPHVCLTQQELKDQLLEGAHL
ncbi:energy-coupling factor transport system ATP-binding protein [Pelagirhabdus alkalitolerans]|uniref:Energy-coupling factor transporter ATP-binding protein EcfA2 n=1 Tax=Pelagirhabdus alkalitolerans TaxID=1612202 RepID=A0A1G6MJ09_9BACI|nr:energy-coupling factor transporter ATPase [Pelagirhabdus alkalitolerans]SDC54945.1 energy-coupling factor transport system ATP-binding protein [Pelagirhabdus alkalitolerans]